MPQIRPFRALRYAPEAVPDIGAVVAPPYDVIGPDEQARLLARHPRNVVRLDLPTVEPGDEPDERYRRAARTLAAWRSDGTLHKDPKSAIYVYEQTYRVPETDVERTQRGFFGRLRLEQFGPESGVLRHERTLEAPREDRYRLLRATGVNTSPVVALYDDVSGTSSAILATLAGAAPDAEVVDDDGVRHRLWIVEADGPAADSVAALVASAGSGPVTIADGHHRYETALRYRDERRMSRSCEEDPAFDYLLTLLLESTAEPLTILPTHRVVRGLGGDGLTGLLAALAERFDVRNASRAELLREFVGSVAPGGAGRFGLWTRDGGAMLSVRRGAFADDVAEVPAAIATLDPWLLGVALEHAAGLDGTAVEGGDRIRYTKSAAEALSLVDAATDGADAAFLLDPTPVDAVTAVARSGEVMPQKSTYFYPKALTGLVINPHEW
ncbi:MAG TPA: DUF1015 domain-containing protein [Candidatus Limnocylindrales bacterium]|nr:DUF1015 domain-containing protein [Candidatus Limnocylindrales bacterium]